MLVLTIHVLTVLISISGFIFRGYLLFSDSSMFREKWVKIVPHVNDTILLISAITLVYKTGFFPMEQPWLMAKLIGLIVYIGLGMVAFRFGKTRNQKMLAWVGAIIVFAYILGLAVTKQVTLGL